MNPMQQYVPTDEEKAEFCRQMSAQIDRDYDALRGSLQSALYAPDPNAKPFELTFKMRVRAAIWRCRYLLAWPFAKIANWLSPNILCEGHD